MEFCPVAHLTTLFLNWKFVVEAARAGELGQELVDTFDQEARRVANGTFYGAILFMGLIAGKIGE